MKKWLIWCLTVLAMVCLIPGIALNAKAVANAFTYCIQCKADKTCDILGYVWQSNADPIYHKIRIKCRTCRTENEIIYKPFSYHTGGTETPTCTTGKICRLCWSEYGILGHDWDAWTSNGDGTHTRQCTVDGCNGLETKDCSGGKAICTERAICEVCGKAYGEPDPKNHTDLKYIPAKAATEDAEGNIEYWYCEGCNKYYSDKDGTKEIKKADTVTAKLPKSPQTGDNSNLMLWIALLFISGGAVISITVYSKKKKENAE